MKVLNIKPKSFYFWLLALFLIAALITYFSETSKSGRYNVLLISIDTLRADRIGMEVDGQALTPHLNAFFQESVRFGSTYSNSHWTMPSHMSIFTGKHVLNHKVKHLNYPPMIEKFKVEEPWIEGWARNLTILDKQIKTIPELLYAANYQTGWFAHSRDWYLDLTVGFGRGYTEVHPFGLDTDIGVSNILDWIDSVKNEKFFAFVHSKLPHSPYIVLSTVWDYKVDRDRGPEAAKMSKDEMVETVISALDKRPKEYKVLLTTLIWSELCYIKKESERLPFQLNSLYCYEIGDLQSYAQLETYYNANVGYADELFGKLIQGLKDRNLYNKTIIIVTSDHGEAFGKHNALEHGTIYNEVLHIPFAMRAPGMRGGDVNAMASSIDILPTLFDTLKIAYPEVDGASLLPIIEGRAEGPGLDRYVIAEGYDYRKGVNMASIQNHEWKLISFENHSFELYNKLTDPDEMLDLSESRKDILNQMNAELLRNKFLK